MGIFDEGCMGMYNAIIPDDLLFGCGVGKERLSQSALYYAATRVSDAEARAVLRWYRRKGLAFRFGSDEASELTKAQVLLQCKTYIAACRIADEYGCDTIGIQYQQGLKDLLPASDLAEGSLNNAERPPVKNARGRIIRPGQPIPHFNEVDECAGLDGLLTNRVHAALQQPVETTLHDIRWARPASTSGSSRSRDRRRRRTTSAAGPDRTPGGSPRCTFALAAARCAAWPNQGKSSGLGYLWRAAG
jgi:hypothetical protein